VIDLIFYKRFSFDLAQYLARRNSIHRFNLRQIEKNRFPIKCPCVVCGEHFLCRGIDQYLQRQHYGGGHVCYGCDLKNKVRLWAASLFHLISAIPQAERDRDEIYPADFRTALIPLPLQSNWGWRRFEEWHRQGVVLCGISDKSATGQDSWGLRDYSEPTRLLNKFVKYEFAYRQKAVAPAQNILVIERAADYGLSPDWNDVRRDCERRLSLWLLDQLKTPEEQSTLKRIARLYKNSCWWSKKEKRRLFDKCEASSWEANRLWKPGQHSIQLEPPDALKLEKKERREVWRVARLGGQVEILGPPAKRHANLAKTQADYNEQWRSYWNYGRSGGVARLSRQLRELHSLNIPHETIELRNNMVANLERDFARYDETKAA
jgi:hypothetical protein